jgi:hypothetical protein
VIDVAFRHGKDAEVVIDSNNLSQYSDSASLSIDVDTAETTTFGKDWKTHIEGLAGATIELSGNYDPTAVTGPAIVLLGLIGGGEVPVVYYPGGNVAGQISHSFDAILTNYSESSSVSDKVTFSASLIVTDEVTSAIVGA